MVTLPKGIQPGQSHSTGRAVTSLIGRMRAAVEGRLDMTHLDVAGEWAEGRV